MTKTKPTILVTGGAGYIGSHIVRALSAHNYRVVAYDNLHQGHRQAITDAEFIKGDLLDAAQLDRVFAKYRFDAVFHLAGYIQVGESMQMPSKYLRNNVLAGTVMLEAMTKHKVNKIIFSSTASVYAGLPTSKRGQSASSQRLKETSITGPTNPYGISKWMFEQMLAWHCQNKNLNYVALRYFNAAGAHPSGDIGEDHQPETHLIPVALKTALGLMPALKIFGDDYPTPDGTCIRDYIHIMDIAQAHILALNKLLNTKPQSKTTGIGPAHQRSPVTRSSSKASYCEVIPQGGASTAQGHIYNLGNGKGFSVKEIIQTVQEVTGKRLKTKTVPRRFGDPAILVADASLIKKELGWQPEYPTIASIIESAWRWHQSRPHGFSNA